MHEKWKTNFTLIQYSRYNNFPFKLLNSSILKTVRNMQQILLFAFTVHFSFLFLFHLHGALLTFLP